MTDNAARCPACAATAPYWRPDDRECEICLALAEMPDEISELADVLDNLPGILGADYGTVLRLRQIHRLLAEHVATLAAERERRRWQAPMTDPLEASFARVETFVKALEHYGHGRSIVSCRYGHEAHWPGENHEYVPLHAGDLRDLVDAMKQLLASGTVG